MISIKKFSSCAASLKFLREIFSTARMAEFTFGGGENAPAGTVLIYFCVPYALIDSDKILSFLLRAMRSATSFWIKKTSVEGWCGAVRNFLNSAPVM